MRKRSNRPLRHSIPAVDLTCINLFIVACLATLSTARNFQNAGSLLPLPIARGASRDDSSCTVFHAPYKPGCRQIDFRLRTLDAVIHGLPATVGCQEHHASTRIQRSYSFFWWKVETRPYTQRWSSNEVASTCTSVCRLTFISHNIVVSVASLECVPSPLHLFVKALCVHCWFISTSFRKFTVHTMLKICKRSIWLGCGIDGQR